MEEGQKKGSPGDEGLTAETPTESHLRKVQRFQVAKTRSQALSHYILAPERVKLGSYQALKAARAVDACGAFLVFRHYYTIGEYRMVGNRFCGKHLYCALCALRRAAKQLRAYLEKAKIVLADNPTCRLVFGTLTIKNGPDLMERFHHLKGHWAKMVKRRSNFLKGRVSDTLFGRFVGAVATYELTNKGKGWHPHIHFIALVDETFDCDRAQVDLSREWHELTGDSHQVDIREIEGDDEEARLKAFVEVFKYPLKLNDMSLPDQAEAAERLHGKRLIVSFGSFYGVKVPEDLNDDTEDVELLPYIEVIYRFSDFAGYQILDEIHRLPARVDECPKDQLAEPPLQFPEEEVFMY